MSNNHGDAGNRPDSGHGFQSGVAGLKLSDILELKQQNRFHGLLVVQHQKKTAKIYFSHGELQHAEVGDLIDEAAMLSILKWPGGKIKVLPQMEYPRKTLSKSLNSILIGAGLRSPETSPLPHPRQTPGAVKPGEPTAGWSQHRRIGVFGILALGLMLLFGGGGYILLSAPAGTEAQASIERPGRQERPENQALSSAPQQKLFTLHGSNTIGASLAPALVEKYLQNKGISDIRITETAPEEMLVTGTLKSEGRTLAVEIQAHGSSTSFKGLKERRCDVGMASRGIKQKELLELADYGDMGGSAAEHVLAMDGLAVVIHPANQLVSLNVDEISGLFSGRIRDWSQIPQSGIHGPVHIYARDDKSGTYDTFKSLVLKPNSEVLSPQAKRYEDSYKLSELVSKDEQGIGFIGLPYISPAKGLAVADKGTRPVYPTPFTVATEDYPLSRRLFLYLPPKSNNVAAREFVEFALSDQGQQIAGDIGFVKLSVFEQKRALAATDEVPTDYLASTRTARRLSVNFRFRSGGTILDNKGIQDLSRIVKYLNTDRNRDREISLFGFADKLGSHESNCAISLQRAHFVEDALNSFGIYPAKVKGFCDDMPIASNLSRNGRQKNRRVEVWIN